jgi:hypothetical protein
MTGGSCASPRPIRSSQHEQSTQLVVRTFELTGHDSLLGSARGHPTDVRAGRVAIQRWVTIRLSIAKDA